MTTPEKTRRVFGKISFDRIIGPYTNLADFITALTSSLEDISKETIKGISNKFGDISDVEVDYCFDYDGIKNRYSFKSSLTEEEAECEIAKKRREFKERAERFEKYKELEKEFGQSNT